MNTRRNNIQDVYEQIFRWIFGSLRQRNNIVDEELSSDEKSVHEDESDYDEEENYDKEI